ncbi:FTR1 family protein [Caldicellulosiruptor naganoensis]|uniref:FTR1 family protein n=1 Tax=Caldicellulosiruptor naganoensis TaxID=29324 RepID=A0ABY7BHC0_9FIRM|nr:FTR1 family protein [Caldicellulosiruptor naganoensis]WAM31798.1 FTR1 family protein [Caldicellulosiruptor naganoensis]
MVQGFVIAFREVFEIILVVAVMIGVIQKLNQKDLLKSLNIGLALGIVLSALLGIIVFDFYESLEESFEGIEIALKALLVILITWFLALAIKYQKRDLNSRLMKRLLISKNIHMEFFSYLL